LEEKRRDAVVIEVAQALAGVFNEIEGMPVREIAEVVGVGLYVYFVALKQDLDKEEED